ncbi:MAG: NUDIX domain-containing protein [Pyrinomonadaceae bacterium]
MQLSAGILLYRFTNRHLEVLIAHPGGPFWKNKDLGAWSIPKGEFLPGQDPLNAAMREFHEETGHKLNASPADFITLTPVKLRTSKLVHAFALEKDLDVSNIKSNTFELEWPPRSGKKQQIPEIDRAEWHDLPTSKQKLHPSQALLVEELIRKLGVRG